MGAARKANHQPTRTCVGCRTTAPQAELLRIALVGGAPVADPARRAPGRGVYVHTAADCLRAAGRGGLARALRRSVSRAELDVIASIASQGRANAVERAPQQTSSPTSDSSTGA